LEDVHEAVLDFPRPSVIICQCGRSYIEFLVKLF